MTLLSNEAKVQLTKEITGAVMKKFKAELETLKGSGSEYIRNKEAGKYFDVSKKNLAEWEKNGLIKYKASSDSRAVFYKISEVYETITKHKE